MPEVEPEEEVPPLVIPDEDAPVLPDVPALLDVPPWPAEEEVPVLPDVPDGLDAPPWPLGGDDTPAAESPALDAPTLELLEVLLSEPPDDGWLSDVAVEGPIEPCAEPVVAPMPDADPDAEPLALGPLVAQAANVNAHVKGNNHFFMQYSFKAEK